MNNSLPEFYIDPRSLRAIERKAELMRSRVAAESIAAAFRFIGTLPGKLVALVSSTDAKVNAPRA